MKRGDTMYQLLEKYSTLLLKVCFGFLSLPAIFIFCFLGYHIIIGLIDGNPLWFLYIVYFLVMSAAVIFIFTLIPSFKVVTLYEKDQLFSQDAAKLMNLIMKRLGYITILFLIQLPFWYMIAQWDDAPGIIIIISYIMGIAFTLTLIASVLKQIIEKGIA